MVRLHEYLKKILAKNYNKSYQFSYIMNKQRFIIFSGDVIATIDNLITTSELTSERVYPSWDSKSGLVCANSDMRIGDDPKILSRVHGYHYPESLLTRHRFLAAPYSGTGYLQTVMKPKLKITDEEPDKNKTIKILHDDINDTS